MNTLEISKRKSILNKANITEKSNGLKQKKIDQNNLIKMKRENELLKKEIERLESNINDKINKSQELEFQIEKIYDLLKDNFTFSSISQIMEISKKSNSDLEKQIKEKEDILLEICDINESLVQKNQNLLSLQSLKKRENKYLIEKLEDKIDPNSDFLKKLEELKLENSELKNKLFALQLELHPPKSVNSGLLSVNFDKCSSPTYKSVTQKRPRNYHFDFALNENINNSEKKSWEENERNRSKVEIINNINKSNVITQTNDIFYKNNEEFMKNENVNKIKI